MEREYKHTPGKWENCGGFTAEYGAITSKNGYIVFGFADARIHKEKGMPIKCPDMDEQFANRRLIAAAPCLLEALDALYESVDSGVELTPEVMRKARAAIARATGETR